jgi:C_GCAxxG_C_C family probable redox protein
VNLLTDEDLLQKAYDLGYKYETERGACVQCVLAVVEELLGLGSDEIFRSSYALAGGCALSIEGTCGALSGGVMAISIKHGREKDVFAEGGRAADCYDLAHELYEKFVGEYGSIVCKDVQEKLIGRSYSWYNPKDKEEYEKNDGHRTMCGPVVANTAKWTMEILTKE